MADGLKQATGLWLKESKSGSKYMSGNLRDPIPAGSKLFVFRNDRKSKDGAADYRLMYEVPEDKPEATSPGGQYQSSATTDAEPLPRGPSMAQRRAASTAAPVDDIPF